MLFVDLQILSMRDQGSDNYTHYVQNDNMGYLNDMHINIFQTMGAIMLPPTAGRMIFM